MEGQVRILICDDSRLMRQLLAKMLESDSSFLVVGEADSGEGCLDEIPRCRPDVVLLDLGLPGLNGIECLKLARERQLDAAFLIVSANAQKDAPVTLEALTEGALDYVTKARGMLQMGEIQASVLAKIRDAYQVQLQRRKVTTGPAAGPAGAGPPAAPPSAPRPTPPEAPAEASPTAPVAPGPATQSRVRLTVVGGSSGCVQVLPTLFSKLPGQLRGTMILVLKLPQFLTRQIPTQYGRLCKIALAEAADGQPLTTDRIYIVPGGSGDLILEKDKATGRIVFRSVEVSKNPGEAPSIDALMSSAANLFKDRCRGILVSGTGTDGVRGLASILEVQGETVVQDRASAIAPQLPLAALEADVAGKVLTIPEIAALW
ncbi:MAG: chemotaxis protein CheB [Candidatus Riflebacteria bacterium]|nr:chemotaxis protein CheB [Candidatus Riflebacteria bacterium]